MVDDGGDALSFVSCAMLPAAVLALAGWLLAGEVTPRDHVLGGAAGLALFGAAAVVATVRLRRPTLAYVLAALFAAKAVAMFATQLGYAVFFLGRHAPLIDDRLLAIDRALGFDWAAMLGWFVAHPGLTAVSAWPYLLCGQQAVVLIAAAAMTAQGERLCLVAAAHAIALGVVHGVGLVWPAIGAYAALHLSAADHAGVALVSEARTAAHVALLRAGQTLALPPGPLLGLMTFPSFHAAAAVIFAWGFWSVRWLRVPALAFNGAVLVATLPHGSHHLIDVLAGVALAVVAIAAAKRLRAGLHALSCKVTGPQPADPGPRPRAA